LNAMCEKQSRFLRVPKFDSWQEIGTLHPD
jgi:hypothetical protein